MLKRLLARDRVGLRRRPCRPAAGRSASTVGRRASPGSRSARTGRRTARSRPRRGTTSVAGAVTPALSWPAPKSWPGASRYIARSTMIGTPLVTVMTAETSVARQRRRPRCSTQMLNAAVRPRPCRSSRSGARGAGSRYVTSHGRRRSPSGSASGRTGRSPSASRPRRGTTSCAGAATPVSAWLP